MAIIMPIVMTLALLIGVAMLVIGFMLVATPEEFYKLNAFIIKLIYNIIEYFNKKLFKFNSYFNNLILNKNSVLTYRITIAALYLIVGLGLIYSSYYYSEQGTLPPMIQKFFMSFYSHF